MNTRKLGAAAVVAATFFAGAASAQLPPVDISGGLVNVDLTNIRLELAKNLNVNVSDIPVTVQAPIGVAANVCNVAANVLASQRNAGNASPCEATSTNTALSTVVQRAMKNQQAGTQRR